MRATRTCEGERKNWWDATQIEEVWQTKGFQFRANVVGSVSERKERRVGEFKRAEEGSRVSIERQSCVSWGACTAGDLGQSFPAGW